MKMRIGIPKEVKTHEYRVGMTPDSANEARAHGHSVLVERNAGIGIGASDADYRRAGATIAKSAAEVFDRADLIVKVKEPQPAERKMLSGGQILFTYLHLACDRAQTRELAQSGAVCIAYETVTAPGGGLPLLAPMSQVAGRLAVQAAAVCLERENGGCGKLIGGVPGVPPAKVAIIGGGVVGRNAAKIAAGMGGDVAVLERSPAVMAHLDNEFQGRVRTVYSSAAMVERIVPQSDVVIGGVLIPGAAAPKLVSEKTVKAMRPGAVIVDVAIDQGGCIATARPTTHAEPTYRRYDDVHYCVTNMPGAVPRTSTYALNNATLPYALAIADKGWKTALRESAGLRDGLNVCEGKITCREVAESLGMKYHAPENFLAA
jgi:alanine dehydrogenase